MLFSLRLIFSRLPSSISISLRLYESQTCLSELELRWNISASSAKSMENKWRSWILFRLDPKKYLRRENIYDYHLVNPFSSVQCFFLTNSQCSGTSNTSWLPYSAYVWSDFHLFHDKTKRAHQGSLNVCGYCGSIIHMVGIQSILGALIVISERMTRTVFQTFLEGLYISHETCSLMHRICRVRLISVIIYAASASPKGWKKPEVTFGLLVVLKIAEPSSGAVQLD